MYNFPQLSVPEMRKKIDELKAWQSFLNYPIRIGETFTNPLRSDNNPRCFLRPYSNSFLLTDFSHPEFNSFTIFHAFMRKYSLDYRTAVQMIYKNQYFDQPLNTQVFQIKTGYIKPISTLGRAEIIIEPFLYNGKPSFTQKDKEYWTKRGVSANDLRDKNQPCFSVHHFYVNGVRIYPKTYPCYAFVFPESHNIKLYCPNSYRKFPASNTTTTDVWRWLTFPDTNICIITKSYKDGLLIHKMDLGVDVYAFQNEGVIDQETIDHINETYDMVLIIYDNDQAGIKASRLLKEKISVNCKLLFYPMELGKDTDDMVVGGHQELAKTLITNEVRPFQNYEIISSRLDDNEGSQGNQSRIFHH